MRGNAEEGEMDGKAPNSFIPGLGIRKLTACRFRREKQQSREEKQANVSVGGKVGCRPGWKAPAPAPADPADRPPAPCTRARSRGSRLPKGRKQLGLHFSLPRGQRRAAEVVVTASVATAEKEGNLVSPAPASSQMPSKRKGGHRGR